MFGRCDAVDDDRHGYGEERFVPQPLVGAVEPRRIAREVRIDARAAPLPHAAAALRHGEKHAGLPAEQRAGARPRRR